MCNRDGSQTDLVTIIDGVVLSQKVAVSVSVSPGTFPGLGDDPMARVHVVRVNSDVSLLRELSTSFP